MAEDKNIPEESDSQGTKKKLANHQFYDIVSSRMYQEAGSGKGYMDVQDLSRVKDADIYNKVMRDPIAAKAILMRLHLVAGPDFSLIGEKVVTPYYQELIEKAPEFANCRLNMARSVFEGRSCVKILSNTFTGVLQQETEDRIWWYPSFYHIDIHNLRDEYEDTQLIAPDGKSYKGKKNYLTIFDIGIGRWFKVDNLEHYMIVRNQNEQSKLGQGRALLESCYYYNQLKSTTLKQLMQGVERYGYPWVHVGLDLDNLWGDADGGGTDYQNPNAIARQYANSIAKFRGGQVLVTSVKDKINTIEMNGQGTVSMIRLMEYFDKAVVELILGSSLPYGGGESQGSYARAIVEAGSSSSLIRYDRAIVEEGLQRVPMAIKQYNKKNMLNVIVDGRPLYGYSAPKLKIAREDRDDVQLNISKLQMASQLGLDISKKQAREWLQLDEPDGPDDILNMMVQQQQGMPMEEGMPPEMPMEGEFGQTANDLAGMMMPSENPEDYLNQNEGMIQ